MKDSARVVIVGGGIMGLSIAYNLARYHHLTDLVVLEQSYLCSGASGRNGGGIRAQWSSGVNIELMRESIQICKSFAREMGFNVWFHQGGYLFLARTEAIRAQLEHNVRVQNDHGLRTRMLSPAEASAIVPELDASSLVAASYNPDDAVVFPWPFVWGYADAAARLGVDINTFTRVIGFDTSGDRITGVVTDRGRIRTELVVNATGAWSPSLAALLDVQLPNHPHRHEICASESLKVFLRPLVSDLSDGLYFSQSMRGEIVGGISNQAVQPGLDMSSSPEFLGLYSRSLLRACPVLGSARIVRQWAGCYDITPDQNPIVGPVDQVQGFYQVCGFMGHGFMMAPVMGRRIAAHLAGEQPDPVIDRWNLRRFREGTLLSEGMIIG